MKFTDNNKIDFVKNIKNSCTIHFEMNKNTTKYTDNDDV